MKSVKVLLATTLGLTMASAHATSAQAMSSGSITIHAPVERVWSLVVGVDGWPQWNKAVETAKLNWQARPGREFEWKSRGFGIHSTFQDFDLYRRVSWKGEALGTHAIHSWEFRTTDQGTVVTTVETMTGIVPTLMHGSTQKMLDEVIPSLLKSLKVAAEQPERGR